MQLDVMTRYRLARYLTGADPTELDDLASPVGRVLALALRSTAERREPYACPPRHEALATVLRYLVGDDQAHGVQDAILATDPNAPPIAEGRNRRFGEILGDRDRGPQFVVPNRLPVGLTLLAGRPKVGKSWLILDLARAVAAGDRPVVGVAEVQTGPVCVWALEDNWGRIGARGSRQGIPPDVPLYFRTQPARLPECVDDLAADLEQYRPRLFVVDTLSRIIPPGASLNDSGEMTRALDLAQQLAFAHDCALVLVHHQRKNNDSPDHLDSVMGATGITGAADAIWTISRRRGEDAAVLAITGRDIESELTLALAWSQAECRWLTVDDAASRPASQSLAQRVMQAVQELQSADASTIAEHIGRDRSTVQTELKALRESGRLEALQPKGQGRRLLYSIPGGLSDTGPVADWSTQVDRPAGLTGPGDGPRHTSAAADGEAE